MPGSLKTEAVVLRSIRYGEGDRVLHLYTPHGGRVAAIAKGARKARSRFGGRLEPFFRLRLVLYEGRGDLLTVTAAETVAAYPRLREHLLGFSGAAGGVVCGACEASAFPLDQEAHDFLVAALGRPLAEVPEASDRALRQAERAIVETAEHHAHVQLRPAA